MKSRDRILLFLALLLITVTGCDDKPQDLVVVDDIPPLPPVGIISISLDNAVELQWVENQEPDVAGYRIYLSNRYDGVYDQIGTSRTAGFIDRGAVNGVTAYYAVTAYDYDGNESELSRDVAYDTPRPEGRDVSLWDRFVRPDRAGYDFSEYAVMHFDTDRTDFFFEITNNGIPYLVVWDDSEIQDMGYTKTLDEISAAPAEGWNPTGDALAVRGHTYVIKTFDGHFAKVRLVSVNADALLFDWAYQTARGNPELFREHQQTMQKRTRGLTRRH
ncbi:MAG: hypothetical protein RBU27_00370 [Bacteroidota bacterium]|jgi:hypothetical protein|nr:hypothetical protein [Bacteroidota bacterium]